jgi:hypothetical protein
MLGDQKDAWLDARLEALDYGDIDGICQAARHYPLEGARKTELDTAGYFENNAPRMRCQEGQQPVGSHLQQAAHSDADRLIRSVPKMILLTYKIDAHPITLTARRNVVAPP